MAYKRKLPGTFIGGRRYVRRRVGRKFSRNTRGRVVGRTRTKRGARPNFLFHRWVAAVPTYSPVLAGSGLNNSTSNCSYNDVTGILQGNGSNAVSSFNCAVCFAINDIPNWSEFNALFDQFRLNAVMFQIKMVSNPDSAITPGVNTTNYGNFYPTIWYCPDHDDNAILTVAQLKEFERVRHKVLRPNQELNIMLRPTTLSQVYNTTTAAGYACNFRRSWLDVATPSIPHFGLKFAIDFEGLNNTIVQGFSFKINAKYYFQCKNTR